MCFMALTEAQRKKETILEFLQREGWWQGKPVFAEMIKKGDLKVNGRKVTITKTLKKGDKIEFSGYSFTVAY
jgi:ribosomal 50S subunit-recycling heat shock protein